MKKIVATFLSVITFCSEPANAQNETAIELSLPSKLFETFHKVSNNQEGGFDGTFVHKDSSGLFVVDYVQNISTAYNANIKVGDKIVRLNEIDSRQISIEDYYSVTRGKINSDIKYEIIRPAKPEARLIIDLKLGPEISYNTIVPKLVNHAVETSTLLLSEESFSNNQLILSAPILCEIDFGSLNEFQRKKVKGAVIDKWKISVDDKTRGKTVFLPFIQKLGDFDFVKSEFEISETRMVPGISSWLIEYNKNSSRNGQPFYSTPFSDDITNQFGIPTNALIVSQPPEEQCAGGSLIEQKYSLGTFSNSIAMRVIRNSSIEDALSKNEKNLKLDFFQTASIDFPFKEKPTGIVFELGKLSETRAETLANNLGEDRIVVYVLEAEVIKAIDENAAIENQRYGKNSTEIKAPMVGIVPYKVHIFSIKSLEVSADDSIDVMQYVSSQSVKWKTLD